ncbi:MAG: hypothetical protein LUG60_07270 [Erysipelotrichaceae bacterium]|nr:hypothetical protein [Erysipelotrichaceae bacterium]
MEQEGICDDAIFEEVVSGDYTTKRMYTKRRVDGSSYVNLEEICAWSAQQLIEGLDVGLDGKVAYGITYILLNSTIIYGKIGEAFLQTKFQKFSQEDYTLSIAERILSNYDNIERKQAIIQGIKDALNDHDNIYANAVKAAILSLEYFSMKEYEMSDDVEDRFFDNEMIPYEEVNSLITYKECGKFNKEIVLHQLQLVYTYLLENDDIIYVDFKNYFSYLIKEEMIVYYIANGDIKEINYIMQQLD